MFKYLHLRFLLGQVRKEISSSSVKNKGSRYEYLKKQRYSAKELLLKTFQKKIYNLPVALFSKLQVTLSKRL